MDDFRRHVTDLVPHEGVYYAARRLRDPHPEHGHPTSDRTATRT